jgi:hypothetical protein
MGIKERGILLETRKRHKGKGRKGKRQNLFFPKSYKGIRG